MENNYVDRIKNLNIWNVLVILLGCLMLPLWGLIFYYSFKEGPILIQSVVVSSAAIGVAFCFIFSAIFRRAAAVIALAFTVAFITANFAYNAYSFELLAFGLIFAGIFFLLPSLFLFLSSIPRYRTLFSARTNSVIDIRLWVIGTIAIFLLLIVLGAVYWLGLAS